MVLARQQRVGQVAEELLEQARDAVDVVEEVLGVGEVEVDVLGVLVEHGLELVDVLQRARLAVDALDAQAVQVDSLDALLYYHGHRQAVALVEVAQRHVEDWVRGMLVGR